MGDVVNVTRSVWVSFLMTGRHLRLLCAFDDCPAKKESTMAVSPRSSEGSAKNRTKAIREWAIGEGLEVSSRGRISAEIERAFHDAAAKKVRIEAEPAKKAVSKESVSKKAPVKRVTASKAPAKKTADVEKVVAETTPAKKMTKEIREWAIGQGLDVSSRGRISAEIERAFHDAAAKKVQVKPARVKKSAAKRTTVKTTVAKTTASKAPASKATASKAPAKKTADVEKAVAATPAKKMTKEIREWAIGQGLDVSSRGRISAEIERAFHDAAAKKVQVKAARVKKSAAKKAAAKKTAAGTTGVKTAPAKAPAKKTAAKAAAAKTTATETTPAKKMTKEIREWAIGQGLDVSSRGRISAEIERAFHDAAAKKVQVKAARVNEAAAKKAPAKTTAVKTAVAKTRAAKTTAAKPTATETTPVKKMTKEIREWAIGEGLDVSSRGRISAEIERAFHDAAAKKVQVKAAPARKSAARKAPSRTTAAKTKGPRTPAVKKSPAKTTPTKMTVAKTTATGEAAPAKNMIKEIREWAIGEGRNVSSRGRISAEIKQAFHDAQVQVPVAVG
ncbi:histone-like nucleoid-structuring protein Lsr2 [Rhodococcus oxybenzonivorans]|uniref:Histone-like nucleoid-structuring protein Lsr2 n=2 Tax=Nocardiaceae TaxID=85025 RepID=A0AAE4UZX2_9NOCA|nr:histone-like nucleoid-structuring protein Lsr2 [Rhodococcus oxybenzonivorans]MDV7265394.1 histone-like nucleoid-structuring protein Lsr2 [Rhodococcus oxybenzonivorans]